MSKERIMTLRQEIRKHIQLYDQNRPIISDAAYDALFQELVALEAVYPEYYDPDSPTQRIVTEFVDALEKRRHRVPLLSLDKATTKEGVLSFTHRLPKGALAVQDKFDGLTISLTYGSNKKNRRINKVLLGNFKPAILGKK